MPEVFQIMTFNFGTATPKPLSMLLRQLFEAIHPSLMFPRYSLLKLPYQQHIGHPHHGGMGAHEGCIGAVFPSAEACGLLCRQEPWRPRRGTPWRGRSSLTLSPGRPSDCQARSPLLFHQHILIVFILSSFRASMPRCVTMSPWSFSKPLLIWHKHHPS